MQIILDNNTLVDTPDCSILQTVADYILTQQGQPSSNISVGVFYVDNAAIQDINLRYRHQDKTTDVISFRLIDNPQFLPITPQNFPMDYDNTTHSIYIGEIFICVDVASAQALEYGHSTEREILELFIHGMLHVLGYDHHSPQDSEIMYQHELDIVQNLDKIISKERD